MPRTTLLLLSTLATLALVACNRGGELADTDTSKKTPATPAAAAPQKDPGPQLKRLTGERKAHTRPELQLAADGILNTKVATYLQIPMPEDMSTLVRGSLSEGRVVVQGERHGFAVPAGLGRVRDRPLAYLRLVGAAAPGEVTLRWYQAATEEGEPGQIQSIKVSVAKDAERDAAVERRFYEAAGGWFQRRGRVSFARRDPFSAFASTRLRALGGRVGAGRVRPMAPAPNSEMAQMMRLYTGATSVDEALQHNRGLLLPPTKTERIVDLSEVDGLSVPGHPWDRMMKAVGEPVIEPLAAYVPQDTIYLHFHDLRTFARLSEEVDELVRPLARVLEEKAGEGGFVKAYETQLAIRRSPLTKTLGHLAAKGIALVAGDPLLREGTDLSLIFHVQNQAALDATLARYEAETKQARPDATVSTVKIAGQDVRLLATRDRDVYQHRLALGEVLIVSNSPAAIQRIIRTHAGEVTSLAKAGDFRYFRARYPYDKAAEDAFAFISDALVGKVIGPRLKIAQARRMAARAELMALHNAALLDGWMNGVAPTDGARLVSAGLMDTHELKHATGGTIELDAKRGAWSDAWGRPHHLRPLAEVVIDKVSRGEQGAYGRFRESYQRFWKGYIDPIGVRIKRDPEGKGVDVEAVMMPLIKHSDYNSLERMVGRRRMKPTALAEGLRFSAALAADSRLRKEIDRLGRAATGSREIGVGWLGDWVMGGVGDRSGLWDVALAVGEVPSAEGRRAHRDRNQRMRVWDRFPLYVGAHVRDRLALAATLAALKAFVNSAAPGVTKWGEGKPYREQQIVTVEETLGATESSSGIKVHYVIVKNVLLLSLERATLEAQIDAVLDGRVPAKVDQEKPPADAAQAILALRPGKADGWLAKTVLGLLERGALSATRSSFRAWESLAVGAGATPSPELARAWLGYVPAVGHGGAFSMKEGLVSHSLYGSEVAPKVPELPVEGSPVSAFVRKLDGLRMTLSFDGEGDHRGLKSTLHWRHR